MIIAVALSSLTLGAASFSAGVAGGYRESLSTSVPYNFEAEMSISDFSLWARLQGNERIDLSLEYDMRVGSTIEHVFNVHSAFYPSLGGFADIEYEFTQQFRWDFFSLGYGLGAQAGVWWDSFGGDPRLSLSPIIDAELGFHFGPVDLVGYLTMDHKAEREWKALPVIGTTLSWRIGGHSTIYADAYFKMAEYLMDPKTRVSGWAVRLGYVYRGRIV